MLHAARRDRCCGPPPASRRTSRPPRRPGAPRPSTARRSSPRSCSASSRGARFARRTRSGSARARCSARASTPPSTRAWTSSATRATPPANRCPAPPVLTGRASLSNPVQIGRASLNPVRIGRASLNPVRIGRASLPLRVRTGHTSCPPPHAGGARAAEPRDRGPPLRRRHDRAAHAQSRGRGAVPRPAAGARALLLAPLRARCHGRPRPGVLQGAAPRPSRCSLP
jgi:hypothetical protein